MLYTFEPNEIWAEYADVNLRNTSSKYLLTNTTFEESVANVISININPIDIAFIDAIHTREFVSSQLEIVLQYASNKCIIFLDDINFSDEMRQFWYEIAQDDRFISAYEIDERVGVLEFMRN